MQSRQRSHTGAPENGCVGTSGQRCAVDAIYRGVADDNKRFRERKRMDKPAIRCGVVDDNETILLAEAYGQASIGVMKA